MKFIARYTDYAVRALCYMARHSSKKDVFTVRDIARSERLPERFLRRILKVLAKKGILVSNKGQRGGFSLNMSPDEVSLTRLIKVFQGEIDITNCFLKKRPCPRIRYCAFRKQLVSINKIIKRELKKVTIASLVNGG